MPAYANQCNTPAFATLAVSSFPQRKRAIRIIVENPMPDTYETNIEFMERIMNFCPHGPLIQAFVLEALRQYAETVADPKVHIPDTALLSGQAWKRTGEWLSGQLEAHLNQHY